jgi:poly(3-hydroxybutyrate) depolymerase
MMGLKSSRAISSLLLIACALLFSPAHAEAKSKPQKVRITFNGKNRTYYLFVPENAPSAAPLLLLLHGSGHDGMSLIGPWKDLAEKEGIILLAPDALDSETWSTTSDNEFLKAAIDDVGKTHAVENKRIYLFGHSAGAVYGLYLAVMEYQYFAAVAVHAGALPDGSLYPAMRQVPRKTPLAIWVGTNDTFFPLDKVRSTRDAFAQSGFKVELNEIAGHTHDYYSISGRINRSAWEFLRKSSLDAEPKWISY